MITRQVLDNMLDNSVLLKAFPYAWELGESQHGIEFTLRGSARSQFTIAGSIGVLIFALLLIFVAGMSLASELVLVLVFISTAALLLACRRAAIPRRILFSRVRNTVVMTGMGVLARGMQEYPLDACCVELRPLLVSSRHHADKEGLAVFLRTPDTIILLCVDSRDDVAVKYLTRITDHYTIESTIIDQTAIVSGM